MRDALRPGGETLEIDERAYGEAHRWVESKEPVRGIARREARYDENSSRREPRGRAQDANKKSGIEKHKKELSEDLRKITREIK
jgi:hypothetical protein